MSKKLILHIGHYKTGTTALQVFFEDTTDFLSSVGLDYPDIRRTYSKHSDFAFSILRAAGVEKLMYNYSDPTPPLEMWGDLYDHMRRSDLSTTLISSEEFMRLGQFPEAVRLLREVLAARPDGVELQVIAYLRDPASHLQSWYNQLIKMNFPLPDLDAALADEIEPIHYDYRLALEPWADIVGRENLLIRPYVHDRNDPAALHRDFLAQFAIALPEALAQFLPDDPNPRLDDRVLELVRLMQNLDFPPPTIRAIRNQALNYLQAQDRLAPAATADFDRIRARARAGLDWLNTLPGSGLDPARLAAHLPEPQPREALNQTLLLGFVFSEFIQLRQRVNKQNVEELTRRVEALENRLAGTAGQDKP